jgi:hypothetical protein
MSAEVREKLADQIDKIADLGKKLRATKPDQPHIRNLQSDIIV